MSDVLALEDIARKLRAEDYIPESSMDQAGALMERLRTAQPWYVRTMVGIGAWLASILLIGSVAGFGIMLGGYLIVGLALVAGAVALRRQSDNDFMVQVALAASLAGQLLVAWWVTDVASGNNPKLTLLAILSMSTVLFFIFPDRIHRVLSVVFGASALIALVYAFRQNALVPLLGPAFAACLVLLQQRRARITAAGHGHLLRPLANGLMLSAFGCLMLSTVYLLPELGVNFEFYPRPWISTLLLGALLLHVARSCLPALLTGSGKAAQALCYGMLLAIIACAWAAPGLLLALVVAMLGAATGHRSYIGAGIAFLAIFVAAYFYGIEMTMLEKSITLVASGTAVLAARWLLLNVIGDAEPEELQRD